MLLSRTPVLRRGQSESMIKKHNILTDERGCHSKERRDFT